MTRQLIALLSACTLASAVQAGSLAVDVTAYDYNTLVAIGQGEGTATLRVNGVTAQTKVVSGAYTLVAGDLQPGRAYAYEVTLGEDVSRGEIVTGSRTAALFGANAATGADQTTGGAWNDVAPYALPVVADSAYVLEGSSNLFDVATKPSSKIVYVESTMTFLDGADELDPQLSAIGAFTLAQTNDQDVTDFFWAGLTGGQDRWVALTGMSPEPGTFVSLMEFDLNDATAVKVRYSLKRADSDQPFVVLSCDGVEWFPVAGDAAQVSSVAYTGTGRLSGFSGSSLDVTVARIGGTDYADIATALGGNDGATVELLTNSRPEANGGLVDKSWTIAANGNDFAPYDAIGYEHSYVGGSFAVTAYETRASASGTAIFGFDFTNGTFRVDLSGSHIQAGTSVDVAVTVRNESGQVVAQGNYAGITGDVARDLAIPDSLTAKGTYAYDIVVTKDGETVAETHDTFIAGKTTDWFDARETRWSQDGVWRQAGEVVSPSGEKLSLANGPFEFTPGAAGAVDGIVRVDTVIEVTGALDWEDLPEGDAVQGMIAIAETSAADPTPVWKAYVNGSWVALTGGSTEPGTYVVRAEFDYTRLPGAVRYSVALNGGAFATLSSASGAWLPNGNAAARTLDQTSAMGVGNLVSLVGETIDAFVAEVDGVKYESLDAALAAADDKPVRLLWNCTWTPGRTGRWTLTPDGKTLVVVGSASGEADFDGTTLVASNVKVAKVGTAEYYFLKKAFADAGETVTLLTNVVESADVVLSGAKTLDLAGWYVSGTGSLVPQASASLVITNSTGVAGGFDLGLDEGLEATVKGGRWRTNEGTPGAGYKFFELAVPLMVDGVAYAYEAKATTEEKPAKVYPVAGDEPGAAAGAVVTDEFVADNVEGAGTKTAAEIAEELNAPRTTGNGMPLIQSYVLGLDPKDETAKPVVRPTQVVASDKVGLSLGNVAVNAKAGVKVSYSLSTATSPGFTDASTTAVQESSSFEATVPTVQESKVRYYRINVHFGK